MRAGGGRFALCRLVSILVVRLGALPSCGAFALILCITCPLPWHSPSAVGREPRVGMRALRAGGSVTGVNLAGEGGHLISCRVGLSRGGQQVVRRSGWTHSSTIGQIYRISFFSICTIRWCPVDMSEFYRLPLAIFCRIRWCPVDMLDMVGGVVRILQSVWVLNL